jgi:hypothetical protein
MLQSIELARYSVRATHQRLAMCRAAVTASFGP